MIEEISILARSNFLLRSWTLGTNKWNCASNLLAEAAGFVRDKSAGTSKHAQWNGMEENGGRIHGNGSAITSNQQKGSRASITPFNRSTHLPHFCAVEGGAELGALIRPIGTLLHAVAQGVGPPHAAVARGTVDLRAGGDRREDDLMSERGGERMADHLLSVPTLTPPSVPPHPLTPPSSPWKTWSS